MPTLELPPHVDESRARLILAVGLFQEDHLPVGKAAEIAGLSYRAFVDLLIERGIPPYPADEDPDTMEAELQTIRDLVRDVEARR